jgi:TatD DNase family protein
MLIDSHAHLDMEEFNPDRDRVIDAALSSDIRRIITIGIDVESSIAGIKLAQAYPPVFATVGIHPHNADNVTKEDLAQISLLLDSEKVIGVGEIGLDFYRNRSSRQNQINLFKQQLEIAMSLNLPVVMHARESHADILKTLSSFKENSLTGVIHCFSGDYNLAKTYIEKGYYISIPGTVTYKNANQIRDVVSRVPLHRILLETDSPFLAPVPYRGKRNEPSYLVNTALEVAKIRGISFEAVSTQTTENVCKLFNLSFPEE